MKKTRVETVKSTKNKKIYLPKIKNKVMCMLCEEELFSDAEEDEH